MDDLYRREPEIKGTREDHWAESVEKEYSKLESKAARVRDRLLSGTPPSALNASERESWAAFVATLEHRSPRKLLEVEIEAKNHIHEYSLQLMEHSRDTDYSERVLASIDTDAVAANVARTTPFRFLDQLSQPILDLRWAIVTVQGGIELITADYPIAHLLHEEQRVLTSIPLSPSTLFVAGATDFSEWDPGLFLRAAISVNLQIIAQCPNYIYSASKLEDGKVFRLKKAALDCLPKPGASTGN